MTEVKDLEDVDITDVLQRQLVVFNDDHNSFDHVIQTFVEVLKQGWHQAEQCAYIIHNKGRCTVKQGLYEELKEPRDKIRDKGIDARIE